MGLLLLFAAFATRVIIGVPVAFALAISAICAFWYEFNISSVYTFYVVLNILTTKVMRLRPTTVVVWADVDKTNVVTTINCSWNLEATFCL